MTRRRRADDDDDLATNLQRNDSGRGHGSYRSLLHENMSLLDKLRQQEDLCRALETQMGDIDSKMDNVADQHLKTLGEKAGSDGERESLLIFNALFTDGNIGDIPEIQLSVSKVRKSNKNLSGSLYYSSSEKIKRNAYCLIILTKSLLIPCDR